MFRYATRPALLIRIAMFVAGLMAMPALATQTGATQMGATQNAAMEAASPVGVWTTANGHGVVAISQCGDALCGRIEHQEKCALRRRTDAELMCKDVRNRAD